jgi:quercetin dioxygenase-like cupin family protein
MVQQGRVKFVLDGTESVVGAGEAVHIPPHLPHSAEALEDTVVIDLFSPPREDWIRK